jgi:hypothetical protein
MRARLAAGVLAAIACAIPAASAFAHEGNPSFRSEIERLDPATRGISVEVLNFDDSLRLENQSGQTVVVEGYEHEPYIRIGPDGRVEVNERSPAYYLNQDRFAAVDVPDSVDPTAPPRWRPVDETGQYAWHDHRAHYMGQGTPPQVNDPDVEQEVFDYSIPIRVDGERVRVLGTLTWVGAGDSVPIAPFVALAVVALAAIAVVVVRRRRRTPGKVPEGEAW